MMQPSDASSIERVFAIFGDAALANSTLDLGDSV